MKKIDFTFTYMKTVEESDWNEETLVQLIITCIENSENSLTNLKIRWFSNIHIARILKAVGNPLKLRKLTLIMSDASINSDSNESFHRIKPY